MKKRLIVTLLSLISVFSCKEEKNEEKIIEKLYKNPQEMLSVSLLFKKKPILIDSKLEESLKKKFQKIKSVEKNKKSDSFKHYLFEDYKVKYQEGEIPTQGVLFFKEEGKLNHERFSLALEQSHTWGNAEETLNLCKYEIVLTDLLSKSLGHKERVECFQKYVESIIKVLNPDAVYIRNSDKIITQKEFVENNGVLNFVNVRMYNTQNQNEILMETLGLNSLGLNDFEYTFNGIQPNQIANLLYRYTIYSFENGNIIQDGNTIEGITKDEKLICRRIESATDPIRIVMKLSRN